MSKINETSSGAETDGVGELESVTDTATPLKKGMRILAIGFGGFLLWAALAPLDEGVPTGGLVSVATKRKPIQHLTGGILDDVFVRDGQNVKAGQILAHLDDGVAKANYEAAMQRYMGLQAMESRLVAVQSFANAITFPSEVLNSADPMVQQQVANQQALFMSQKAGFEAEMSSMREAQMGQRAMITAYQATLETRREQYASLQEEMQGIREMVAEGYLPKSRERDLERQLAAARGAIAELNGNISRAMRAISEIELKMSQRRQSYREQSETQLASIRLELQANREKFKATAEDLARTTLRSPVDGQVIGLQLQSKGAVLMPGQKLMDIVPRDEELVIETKIAPNLVDRVREGQLTEVQFSSFANSSPIVVDGRVRSVARDLLAEQSEKGVMPFYAAQIVITKEGMKKLGSRELRPGMPVEIIIKTGSRTMLQYLLKPLTKRFDGALRED